MNKTLSGLVVSGMILFLILASITWVTPRGRSVISVILYRIRGGTGTLYFVRGDGSKVEQSYQDGLRSGVWKTWDKDGRLINQSVYRNGDPWDGVCYLQDGKGWLCEYKNGQPWNGFLPKPGKDKYPDDWGYFINGAEESYSEYCKHCGKDEALKPSFYGLHCLGIQSGDHS